MIDDDSRQPYLVPFSLMVIITVVMTYLGYVDLSYLRQTDDAIPAITYLDVFTWPLITALEAVLYWVLRYRVRSNLLVWMHLSCMLFAFVALNMVSAILDNTVNNSNISVETAIKVVQVKYVLFLIAIVIGHAFFITVLINGFKRRKDAPTAESSIFAEDADIE